MISNRCEAHRINDDYHALCKKPVKKALVEIGERFLELMYTPDVVDLNRVIISEASTKPKIAQLLYEAGPAPCKAAFSEFLCEMHARGELVIDDAERATQHFFCLLKGERFYTVLMNLQGPPSKREKNAHLKDCIEVFVRAYQPQ
jgi:TetR/AcrR family transcriptional repressor of mexJK operon